MNAEVGDGDLVRLARDGDAVAFRLLVERHLPMVRARARRLCGNPSDVDDVVQESLLRAFLALERLRDPDRFGGWLAGIVHNVCRTLQRVAPVTLLSDWPEPLHPAGVDGQPSAEALDRAAALHAAVASLPAGQRRAVALHYYADQPAGQAGESAGAARASLHKARHRLRDYLTEHRPDLASSRRTPMTTVRIARVESRIPPGPVPIRYPSHVVVLADDRGHRELPVWLLGDDGVRLSTLSQDHGATARAQTAEELAIRLLHAAGARLTGVDIDDLGPQVTVARIGVSGPAGTRQVPARLADGLALAMTAGTGVRVTDGVMDRLAVPATPGSPSGSMPEVPEQTARVLTVRDRPRYKPRNMDFGAGLTGWLLDGSFIEHAVQGRWRDYQVAAGQGTAMLSATVPDPAGFAFLGQSLYAEDYRDSLVTFRGQFRGTGDGRAGLFLRVETTGSGPAPRNPLNWSDVLADGGSTLVTVTGNQDWAGHEITARVPGEGDSVTFGIFLAGNGRIELQAPELLRGD